MEAIQYHSLIITPSIKFAISQKKKRKEKNRTIIQYSILDFSIESFLKLLSANSLSGILKKLDQRWEHFFMYNFSCFFFLFITFQLQSSQNKY